MFCETKHGREDDSAGSARNIKVDKRPDIHTASLFILYKILVTSLLELMTNLLLQWARLGLGAIQDE
jgi:hypothetical protein